MSMKKLKLSTCDFKLHTLHYAAVEKLGSKWSTLTSHFSAQREAKNLLLMFAKVNLGVKKFVSPNAKIFVLCIFLANMSKWQKNAFKV